MRLNEHHWSGSTIIDFTFYLVPVGYKFILGQVALQHILYLFLESPIYPVVYFIVIEPSQDDSSYCNHVMISNGFIVTCFFQKQSPGGVLQKRVFKNIRKTHMTHTISIIIKNMRKIFWIMLIKKSDHEVRKQSSRKQSWKDALKKHFTHSYRAHSYCSRSVLAIKIEKYL